MAQIFRVEEPEDIGKRLDLYINEQLDSFSRSHIQKLIRSGDVLVNQKAAKSGYQVSKGDTVSVEIPETVPLEILPENIPLDILYEDNDVLVVNKPKGMVVHPAPGHTEGTLVNALLYHCRDSLSGINGIQRPGIVHRIDQNTTGSLLVCKNDAAHLALAAQLEQHSIHRRYVAIVHGNIKEDEGVVDAPIGRDKKDRKKMGIDYAGGREAITHYRVLQRFGSYTYISCKLETGRTHQIRVHMKSIGHPVLGDDVYGPSHCPVRLDGKPLQGQTLHAMELGFVHPSTEEYMEFTAPLPDYFQRLLHMLGSSGG